jgi:hypothetical protein
VLDHVLRHAKLAHSLVFRRLFVRELAAQLFLVLCPPHAFQVPPEDRRLAQVLLGARVVGELPHRDAVGRPERAERLLVGGPENLDPRALEDAAGINSVDRWSLVRGVGLLGHSWPS